MKKGGGKWWLPKIGEVPKDLKLCDSVGTDWIFRNYSIPLVDADTFTFSTANTYAHPLTAKTSSALSPID